MNNVHLEDSGAQQRHRAHLTALGMKLFPDNYIAVLHTLRSFRYHLRAIHPCPAWYKRRGIVQSMYSLQYGSKTF
jgi:hypothetical protein